MRLTGLSTMASAAVLLVSLAAPAFAGDPGGEWMRSDGEAKVRFGQCGGGYCGTISWLRHPGKSPAQVGEQVFFGMGQSGPDTWTGSAHNPEDGRDYDGSMTMSGNRLVTKGCAMGGMICKTTNWVRAR